MNGFPIKPLRGTVIVYDDQPETRERGVVVAQAIGVRHLDFPVVAVNPHDHLDFGVGSVVVLEDPNVDGDMNHRRRLDGVVYRAVRVEHIAGVVE